MTMININFHDNYVLKFVFSNIPLYLNRCEVSSRKNLKNISIIKEDTSLKGSFFFILVFKLDLTLLKNHKNLKMYFYTIRKGVRLQLSENYVNN